jgi:GT2 family glycosyltransferase
VGGRVLTDLSVLIVNWNGGRELLRALESVGSAADEGVAWEIILVDNASTDGSADEAVRRFPDVGLLRNPANVGFAAGVNAGLGLCGGRFVLLLNPDVRMEPGCAGRLLAFLDAHRRAGACGPLILEGDSKRISPWCARRDPRPVDVFLEYALLPRLFSRHRLLARYTMGDWDHASDRPVDVLSGACMLIRKEALDQVGGFDEGFFLYGEDMDWCRKARGAGWSVWFVAGAAAHHVWGHSARQIPKAAARWSLESHLRYFRKWGSAGDVRAIRLALSLGSLLRAFGWLGAGLFRPERGQGNAIRRSADYLKQATLVWTI